MSKRYRPPQNIIGGIVVFLIFVSILDSLLPIFIPLALVGGFAYWGFNRHKKQELLTKQENLAQLKADIRRADQGLEQLRSYQADQLTDDYLKLAKQLLPLVKDIQSKTFQLKDSMEISIFNRINQKAKAVEKEIQEQVQQLESLPQDKLSQREREILKLAPELSTVYQNIRKDHLRILEKIETASNKAELLALHETSMDRFQDILDGYLKIKASPKDFYKAEERLDEAKKAMESFDLTLDETLRQLNEDHMADFDVSLRLMNDKTQQNPINFQ